MILLIWMLTIREECSVSTDDSRAGVLQHFDNRTDQSRVSIHMGKILQVLPYQALVSRRHICFRGGQSHLWSSTGSHYTYRRTCNRRIRWRWRNRRCIHNSGICCSSRNASAAAGLDGSHVWHRSGTWTPNWRRVHRQSHVALGMLTP